MNEHHRQIVIIESIERHPFIKALEMRQLREMRKLAPKYKDCQPIYENREADRK